MQQIKPQDQSVHTLRNITEAETNVCACAILDGLPSYLDSQEDAQVPGRDVRHAVLQLVGLSLGGRVSFLPCFGLRQITVVALKLH